MSLYHLVIYVPLSYAEGVRKALAESGAGNIGNYNCCSFSAKGIGRFRPLKGANPHIGSTGTIEEVEEERIEVVVEEKMLQSVLLAAKQVHPYEEPAIHFWKMEDYRKQL
jgi:hypothetical protein